MALICKTRSWEEEEEDSPDVRDFFQGTTVTYLMSEGGSAQNTAEQLRGCGRHKGRAGSWRISPSQLLRVLSGVFTPVWWPCVGWVGEEGTGRRAISQRLCCCPPEYGALLSSCSVWCAATP